MCPFNQLVARRRRGGATGAVAGRFHITTHSIRISVEHEMVLMLGGLFDYRTDLELKISIRACDHVHIPSTMLTRAKTRSKININVSS